MAKTKKQKTFRWLAHKPLLAATLAVAGVFNMMTAVLAEGTLAGETISNTATATYGDGTTQPDGTPTTFDAISNTVIVNVAEIAGLTVQSSGFNDVNGGSIVNGDELFFDFTVTNTGNADTLVFVPGPDDTGTPTPGVVATGGTITSIDIINPATGVVIGNVPVGGNTTDNLGLPTVNGVAGAIAPDTGFTVRVTVDVTATTAGDPINVTFGNTTDSTLGSTDNDQQNIPDTSDGTPGTNTDDVRTVNISGTDTPTNGEREAADFREETYATAVVSELAQALILKTSNSNNSGTATDLTDDTIAYSLSLEVQDNDYPTANIEAGSLAGTDITVTRGGTTATEERILVSDVIPAGTVFVPGSATPPSTNWEVVYSVDDPTVAPNNNALESIWTTDAPADPALIKRVGFIYDATTNPAIAPGTPAITSFEFTVVATNVTITPGDPLATPPTLDTAVVANVAQVFGQTDGAPDDNIVFDESGDQDFNNAYNATTDPTNTISTFEQGVDLGIANPGDADPGNNAGTTPDGESNVVTLTQDAPPPASGALVNGPNGTPTAFGPEDSNDDFTNVSTSVDTVGAPGSTGNPAAITITNQLENTTAATELDTITLLPLTQAEAAAGAVALDDDAPSTTSAYAPTLPDTTTVKIDYLGQSATYTVTGGAYTRTAGATIVIDDVLGGDVLDYTVTIDLPAGTAQVAAFEVPIVAFVDNDGDGAFTPDGSLLTPAIATNETIANITINRVYTGFMELVKEVSDDGVTFGAGPIDVAPGEDIFYRITSTNISEDGTEGSGNTNGSILLNASNFKLVDDGTTDGNNWASNTFHVQSTSAGFVDTNTGNIDASRLTPVEYFNSGSSVGTADPATETVAPSAVTSYENEAGTVAPQEEVRLEFTRKIQ